MTLNLREMLGGALSYGALQSAGPLTVLPVFARSPRPYVGLDAAMALGGAAEELTQLEVGRVVVPHRTARPPLDRGVSEVGGDEIEQLAGEVPCLPGQQGFVVAAGSRVWAFDFVADPHAFARIHARLIRGYALDALRFTATREVSEDELRAALARVLMRPLEVEHDEGPERRYRFGGSDPAVEGRVTVSSGEVVAVRALLAGAPQGGRQRRSVRTSETDPIGVSWLDAPGGRALGITFAPGKHASSQIGAPWRRDLELDLLRLRCFHRVDTLVCLLEDDEIERLGMHGYEQCVHAHAMELLRLPIPDGHEPSMLGARSVVRAIRSRLDAGRRLVVHCRGGLGRAGTIAGCVLVASGIAPSDALELLVRARGASCPETDAQRAFVRSFVSHAVGRG